VLATELGIAGALTDFEATMTLDGDTAVLRIGLVRGIIREPFRVRAAMLALARAAGARRLRVEARTANQTVLKLLLRRYGFVSRGGQEVLEVELE
jgi:hypothetical protein